MIGFATLGVLSFHLVARNILPAAAVPLVYAAAMGADAVAALATGRAYDKIGPNVVSALPALAALAPMLAFTNSVAAVIAGAIVSGAAVGGVQESTLRAVVADLVPPPRRATAYGLYAAVIGVATGVGGALTGLLYEISISISIPILIATVVTIQFLAVLCLIGTNRVRSRSVRFPS